MFEPFVTSFLDIFDKEMDLIEVNSSCDGVLLTNPMDISLQFLVISWKNLNLGVVDRAISVLFDTDKLDNWAISETHWLFWSEPEEFVLVHFTEILCLNINTVSQFVSLRSLSWISWEKWSLDIKVFECVQILNLEENWV